MDGVTSVQVNVRAEPSTASNVLGMIPADTRIEITGRDPGGNWWQINYPQGMEGKGWVTTQYIITASTPEVPTIGGTAGEPHEGNIAIVQQHLNVRSGPGTGFNPLGTLNPQDVVSLTGKDPNGAWLQIDFPAGPEGKAWVSAAFVQAQGAENLPIVTESGMVLGTGTPTVIPPTPTLTLVPAREDGDSRGSPIASVIFEPGGIQSFIYNGDVSAPQGDVEDWVVFRPYGDLVIVSLACTGSVAMVVEVAEGRSPGSTDIKCGAQRERVAVQPGADYRFRLKANPSAEALAYTNYILTVRARP